MSELNKVETQFKEKIKSFLNQNSFNTWIKPVKVVNIEGNVVSFQVPSKIHIDYIRGQYRSVFEKTLKDILANDSISIKFLIDSDTDFSFESRTETETIVKKAKELYKGRVAPYKETS